MIPTQSLLMPDQRGARGTEQLREANPIPHRARMDDRHLLHPENRRHEMNAVPTVQAHLVSKSFLVDGKQLPIRHQVSLQVMPGEMVAIMGPSVPGNPP